MTWKSYQQSSDHAINRQHLLGHEDRLQTHPDQAISILRQDSDMSRRSVSSKHRLRRFGADAAPSLAPRSSWFWLRSSPALPAGLGEIRGSTWQAVLGLDHMVDAATGGLT